MSPLLLSNPQFRPITGHIIPEGLHDVSGAIMTIEQTPPDLLSSRQRAREAAALLALGIARLYATLPQEHEISLGFPAPERLHTNPSQPGV